MSGAWNWSWRPRVDLCGGDWKLRHFLEGKVPVRSPFDLLTYTVPSIPAQVPGNVELDLVRAGELKEPFIGDCEALEYHQFWYETMFLTPPFDEPWLVFEGLDCLAEIWVNGERVGTAENSMITHRFSLKDRLAAIGQENKLFVCLTSVRNAGRTRPLEMDCNSGDRYHVRKPGHCFGWGTLPRQVSAGIWRPVYIEAGREHEIDEVYLQTERLEAEDTAYLRLWYHVKTRCRTLSGLCLRLTGSCGTSSFVEEFPVEGFGGEHGFRVEKAQLWWPRGYGEPQLYDVNLELCAGGEVLARRRLRLGIRTVAWDADGALQVNGQKMDLKERIWGPLDPLHSRDVSKLPEALKSVAESDCNALTCWGGSVYEPQAFFDFCDEQGIVVRQDFAFGCGTYSSAESFLKLVREEAEWVVRELRQHACIVQWNDAEGGENRLGGTVERRQRKGRDPVRETLHDVVARLDPGRSAFSR